MLDTKYVRAEPLILQPVDTIVINVTLCK